MCKSIPFVYANVNTFIKIIVIVRQASSQQFHDLTRSPHPLLEGQGQEQILQCWPTPDVEGAAEVADDHFLGWVVVQVDQGGRALDRLAGDLGPIGEGADMVDPPKRSMVIVSDYRSGDPVEPSHPAKYQWEKRKAP